MTNYVAIPGDFNAICDVCGKKTKSSEIQRRWDGLLVCSDDWEERHPLDMPRPPYRDDKAIPFTRPEPTIVYANAPQCTAKGRSATAGFAVAGCSIAGIDISATDYTLVDGSFNITNTL